MATHAQIVANRRNGLKGGRPKGSKSANTLRAEQMREEILQMVGEELEEMLQGLIKQACKGDWRAARVLFDRAFGRPKEEERDKPDYRPIIIYHKD